MPFEYFLVTFVMKFTSFISFLSDFTFLSTFLSNFTLLSIFLSEVTFMSTLRLLVQLKKHDGAVPQLDGLDDVPDTAVTALGRCDHLQGWIQTEVER